MHTGKGFLVLHDGCRLPLNFQFGDDDGASYGGYLHFDTSSLNPADYGDRLSVLCENGIEIQVVVIQCCDRYLMVTGRVALPDAA